MTLDELYKQVACMHRNDINGWDLTVFQCHSCRRLVDRALAALGMVLMREPTTKSPNARPL